MKMLSLLKEFLIEHDYRMNYELKQIFGLSKIILPEVRESSSNFGSTTFEDIFDKDINIFGVIGDSQASMVANLCFKKGDTKITLGTGACTLTNIGSDGGQEVPHLHYHIFAGEKIGKMVS